MEIKDKFKTAYGAARVREQANQLELPCSAATCCQVAPVKLPAGTNLLANPENS